MSKPSTHRAFCLVNADGSYCRPGIIKNAWSEAKALARIFGGPVRKYHAEGMRSAWNAARSQRDSVLHELGQAPVTVIPAAKVPAGEYADSFEQYAAETRRHFDAAVARVMAATVTIGRAL
jgi:hypothetical protein